MKDLEQFAANRVFGGERPTVLTLISGRTNVDNGSSTVDDRPAVKLIAAGPLTAQPGSNTGRVVLIATDKGGQFGLGQLIVYNEYFPEYRYDGTTTKSFYDSGKYFDLTELVEATTYFAYRLGSQVETLGSAYRVEEIIKL